jgi:NAD(P)-dependent dehydrogenase (short-subunit alcohol dehydrogenase family)
MDGDTGPGGIMVVRRMVRDAGVRIDGQPESKLCSLLKPRVYRGRNRRNRYRPGRGQSCEVARVVVPLCRAGQAQDIVNGVLFLASDASSYMTGARLVIGGGMTGGASPRWS